MIDMLRVDKCPACGSSWDGGSILETFIRQRDKEYDVWKNMTDEQIEEYVKMHYSPPYRWGRQIGITDLYTDRTEEAACPDCKVTFNRFTGERTGNTFNPSKEWKDENDETNI